RRLKVEISTVLNLELATAPDVLKQAIAIKPYQVTFVPERREEITTEGGLDLGSGKKPTAPRLDRAAKLGVAAIEFHTGTFAHSWPKSDKALKTLIDACLHAKASGLAVHAGHGLTYRNV